MDHLKSRLAFISELFLRLLEDVYLQLPIVSNPALEMERDLHFVRVREKAAGLSFYTKELPALGKALDRALETGRLVVPRGFALWKRRASVPKFLGRLFRSLFEIDGTLIHDADASILTDMRQLLFVFYKLETGYTPSQEDRVIMNFVRNEEELGRLILDGSNPILTDAADIIFDIFKDFDHRAIVPGHGPGAVSTGERGHEKRVISRKYTLLHEVYPYYEYFFNRGADLLSRVGMYRDMEVQEVPEAKVILVPKDSRGPRLISCEPLEIQFIQQGLMKALYDHIERHPLTAGLINFRDQSINGDLALKSSGDQEYATVDMKDASDLVSLQLVRHLFRRLPHLLNAFEATRSMVTRLPDGRKVHLNKFAPMGSAICFPVEALCFFVLLRCSITRNSRYARGDIYVYGDDILIRSKHYDNVKVLEDFGLKVNWDKSFVDGWFRESCGIDAYQGIDVTPVRLRKYAGKACNVSEIVSMIATSNHLWSKCYYRASNFIQGYVEKLLHTRLPLSSDPSVGYLHWATPRSAIPYAHKNVRYRRSTQQWESRRLFARGQGYNAPVDLYSEACELFRKLTVGQSPEFVAHCYAFRGRLNFKTSWVPA